MRDLNIWGWMGSLVPPPHSETPSDQVPQGATWLVKSFVCTASSVSCAPNEKCFLVSTRLDSTHCDLSRAAKLRRIPQTYPSSARLLPLKPLRGGGRMGSSFITLPRCLELSSFPFLPSCMPTHSSLSMFSLLTQMSQMSVFVLVDLTDSLFWSLSFYFRMKNKKEKGWRGSILLQRES